MPSQFMSAKLEGRDTKINKPKNKRKIKPLIIKVVRKADRELPSVLEDILRLHNNSGQSALRPS
jgi:hypothetical protein